MQKRKQQHVYGRVELPNGCVYFVRLEKYTRSRISPELESWITIALTGLGWWSIGYLIFLACKHGVI